MASADLLPSHDLLSDPEVRLAGWSWRHPGRKAWAVTNVNLVISPGETVLIAGGSGSGKSTLLHGLAGVLDTDEGEGEGTVTIGGVAASSPLVRGRVGLVQQDPESQRVMGRIGDEVAFGLENLGVPRSEIWRRVPAALAQVGLAYPLERPTAELSGGEKQRLALACALAMQPQVILLDEPTANLDPRGGEEVREAVRNLGENTGATIMVVEHNLEPWLPQADRLVVMGAGEILAEGVPSEVLADQQEALLAAGVWVPGVDPMRGVVGAAPDSNDGRGAPALSTTALSVGYGADAPLFDGLEVEFREGTSTCLLGPNGVGKTTLSLTLAGLLAPLGGSIAVAPGIRGQLAANPQEWKADQFLGRLSMVFQEPQYQFVTSSVREELLLGLRLAGVEEQIAESKVEGYLVRLRLAHLAAAHPLSLSGGERRRLGVGAALIASPRILILDEPTFGQDLNTWREVVALLLEARDRGVTLILVTHDLRLVGALGQNVVELKRAPIPEAPAKTVDSREGEGEAENRKPLTYAKARPRRTLLSRVNPATQILALLVMTLPLMVTIDPVSAAVAWLLELCLLPFTGLRPRAVLLRLTPLLLAAPLAAISMLLYAAPGGDIYAGWGPVVISQNSVTLAVSIALRVLAVGTPAVVMLPSLGSTEVADALTQIVHLPSRFVLSSLAAIRMVGLMTSDWQALHRARRSRGLRRSNFARSAFSLITFALRRAEALSMSMEARGFGSNIPRSDARVSSLSRADAVALALALAVPIVALGAAALTGTFSLLGTGGV